MQDNVWSVGDAKVRIVRNPDEDSRILAVLEIENGDAKAIITNVRDALEELVPGNSIMIESFDQSPRYVITNEYVMTGRRGSLTADEEQQILNLCGKAVSAAAARSGNKSAWTHREAMRGAGPGQPPISRDR